MNFDNSIRKTEKNKMWQQFFGIKGFFKKKTRNEHVDANSIVIISDNNIELSLRLVLIFGWMCGHCSVFMCSYMGQYKHKLICDARKFTSAIIIHRSQTFFFSPSYLHCASTFYVLFIPKCLTWGGRRNFFLL